MIRFVRLTWSPSRILLGLAEEDRAHRVLLEVEGEAHDAVGQLEELPGHAALEAVDAGDAVAHAQDGADLGHVDVGGEPPELLAEDPRDLVGPNLHAASFPLVFAQLALAEGPGLEAASRRLRASSRVRTVPS